MTVLLWKLQIDASDGCVTFCYSFCFCVLISISSYLLFIVRPSQESVGVKSGIIEYFVKFRFDYAACVWIAVNITLKDSPVFALITINISRHPKLFGIIHDPIAKKLVGPLVGVLFSKILDFHIDVA